MRQQLEWKKIIRKQISPSRKKSVRDFPSTEKDLFVTNGRRGEKWRLEDFVSRHELSTISGKCRRESAIALSFSTSTSTLHTLLSGSWVGKVKFSAFSGKSSFQLADGKSGKSSSSLYHHHRQTFWWLTDFFPIYIKFHLWIWYRHKFLCLRNYGDFSFIAKKEQIEKIAWLTLTNAKQCVDAEICIPRGRAICCVRIRGPHRKPHIRANWEALEHHVENNRRNRQRPANWFEIMLINIPLHTACLRLFGFNQFLMFCCTRTIPLRFLVFRFGFSVGCGTSS